MEKNKGAMLNFDILGKMKVFDVLVMEDYPVIFVCQDVFSAKYLFYEIDYNRFKTQWLATKITRSQYLDLKDNIKSIQQTFKDSHSKKWYKVTENGKTDITVTEILLDFPMEVFSLDIPIFIGSDRDFSEDLDSLFKESYEYNRAFIDIWLKNNKNRVGSNVVSINPAKLESLTNPFRMFFQDYNIPSESQRLQLLSGSTRVRFYFEPHNLLTNEDSNLALEDFNKAVASNNSTELQEAFKGDVKKIKRYKEIIDVFRKLNEKINVSAITPNKSIAYSHDLSDKVIKEQLEKINNIYTIEIEHKEIVGELYSINVETKIIGFYDENREKVKGELTFDAEKDTYVVPIKYKIKLKIEKKLDLDGNIKSKKFYVESLNEI